METLKINSQGESVKTLQALLNSFGFDSGPTDGQFGLRTEKAVMAFQRAHDLTDDGIVGDLTWNVLHAPLDAPKSNVQVMTCPTTPDEYSAKFEAAVVLPKFMHAVQSCAVKLLKYKDSHYLPVAQKVGCPWWVPALIQNEECGDDVGVFKAYLHNGDPMFDRHGNPIKTVDVPAGKGPFASWAEAAVDALGGDGAFSINDWSIGSALKFFEEYNGTGYRRHGVASPYLWAMTDQYTKGHYVRDGVFDSNAVSDNFGCAAIMKQLQAMGEL